MVSLLELKSLSRFFLHESGSKKVQTDIAEPDAGISVSKESGREYRPHCGGYNEAFILERWAHFEHPER